MNATTAAQKTAASKRRIAADMQRAARQKARDERKQTRWELRVQVPKHMKEIGKEIKDAIAHGKRRADWSCRYTMANEAVEEIERRLQRRKFKVSHARRSGEDNMGDFNAPCNVSWSSTDFTIEW